MYGNNLPRSRRQPSEPTSNGPPSNARSPLTPSTSSEESSSRRKNPRGRTVSVPSNSRSDPRVIYEPAVDLQDHKQQLAAAKRAFKKLARSYVDKSLPPHHDQMRELWKYKDVLDLETILTWRNEVGLRRGCYMKMAKLNLRNGLFHHMKTSSRFLKIFSKCNFSSLG